MEAQSADDRRRYPRLSVDRAYTAHFKLEGQDYVAIQLTDISAVGCCLKVEASEGEAFVKGVHLTRFYLDHMALPPIPLQGQVVRVLGKVPGKTDGYILVGVEFVNVNDHVINQINQHVVQELAKGQVQDGV